MTRKIKNLGLAFVAVAAMSMAAAAAVQASEVHITTEHEAVITGEQTPGAEHVFTTSAGTVKCTTANFEGTVLDTGGSGPGQLTEQELTLTATYSGCKFGGLNATVQMNGCKYTITNKTTAGATTAKTAYVDITGCTPGKSIVVSAGGGLCTATVPEQHHLSHIVFTNEGVNPHDVHANITISGITYELHGAFCPGGGATGLRHDGTYHGKATFKAFKKLGQHLATEHGHQFSKQTHGEQVGLLAT